MWAFRLSVRRVVPGLYFLRSPQINAARPYRLHPLGESEGRVSELPRLYSFEELLASFPEMDERVLRGRVKNLGYRAADGRRRMSFSAAQIERIKKQLAQSSVGCVYFLLSGKAVKIGYSEQFAYRLAELQTGNPVMLEVYKTIAAEKRVERELHAKFRHLRIQGEWFRWCKEIRVAIDRL